jgi:meso-butanediol dehydrogenase / (S,S)-butanediol dehydrogenase / diacetyl reductase
VDWGMKDKIVIITGGANGIGRATAEIFAREGATVVIADWEQDSAQRAAREIGNLGGHAVALECDVSQGESVSSLVQETVKRFGRIDVLHANAAVQIAKPCADTTEEDWDRVHAVNLKGVFLACKYAVPVMKQQKKGSIIITSSGHALASYPNFSAYAATKGGELAFMRALALDYALDGIRANCVIAGATDTRLVKQFIAEAQNPEETRRQLLQSIPMRRLAEPREVGLAVLFLASDFAGYITGTSVAVDGGLLAQA